MPAKKRCQFSAEQQCNSAVLRIVGQCPHCRAQFCGTVSVCSFRLLTPRARLPCLACFRLAAIAGAPPQLNVTVQADSSRLPTLIASDCWLAVGCSAFFERPFPGLLLGCLFERTLTTTSLCPFSSIAFQNITIAIIWKTAGNKLSTVTRPSLRASERWHQRWPSFEEKKGQRHSHPCPVPSSYLSSVHSAPFWFPRGSVRVLARIVTNPVK